MSTKTTPWEVGSSSFSDAYVGGFLDGDGSIVATLEKRPERRRFPYRVRLKINFTQNIQYKFFIERLQEYLGGVGKVRVVQAHNLAELVVQDRGEVKKTLERLLPYLVLKRRQAELLLEAIGIYDKSTVNVRSSLKENEFDDIVKIVSQVRELNSHTGGKRTA